MAARSGLAPPAPLALAPLALALIALLAPRPAEAQARVRSDGVAPRAADFYPADDPQRARKAQIDRIMGVYQVHPPRRHPSERVRMKGNAIQIEVWHPVGRNSDVEIKTRAVQWFVFGRTQYAGGVRGIFSEFPDIQDVRFAFTEVIRPDEKGRRRSKQRDKVKRYLLLRLDRRRFERLDMEKLQGCVERGDCAREFRSLFKDARFDRRYTAKAREDS